jgi:hypothetical protein
MVDDGDKSRGLYEKFKVERTDGSSAPGGKHDGCGYFVLDASCDPHAIPALLAYAESCKPEYPALAKDLIAMAIRNCEHEPTDTLHGPDTVGQHCLICGCDLEPFDYDDFE